MKTTVTTATIAIAILTLGTTLPARADSTYEATLEKPIQLIPKGQKKAVQVPAGKIKVSIEDERKKKDSKMLLVSSDGQEFVFHVPRKNYKGLKDFTVSARDSGQPVYVDAHKVPGEPTVLPAREEIMEKLCYYSGECEICEPGHNNTKKCHKGRSNRCMGTQKFLSLITPFMRTFEVLLQDKKGGITLASLRGDIRVMYNEKVIKEVTSCGPKEEANAIASPAINESRERKNAPRLDHNHSNHSDSHVSDGK